MGEVSKSAVIDSNILIYHINGQMDLVAEAAGNQAETEKTNVNLQHQKKPVYSTY